MKFLLLLLICVGPPATGTSGAPMLNIVATLPDFAAIAREIGGDRVTVISLAKGTEDPHFVDARPSFIRALNQADVLIEGGADLEIGWLPHLVNNARNAKILGDMPGHIIVGRGVRLLEMPSGGVDRSQGDVHPAGNPHFNLDPMNGKNMAATIAAALGKLEPASAAFFEANRRAFSERLEAKVAEWTRTLAPYRGTKVITYHKSFDYLLDRFGFELVGTIEPKPGLEPSPTHVGGLIPRAREAGVKLIVIEPNRPRRTPQRVAEGAGARLLVLPVLVNGAEQATNYIALFDHVVAQIAAALKPPA